MRTSSFNRRASQGRAIEPTDQTDDFSRRQLRAFGAAWIAYAAYYLCRLNLAGAQATIEEDLELTKGQIGSIITLFSLAYGLGQLVNGAMCDRFGARRMLTTGLVGTAAANLLFSSATNLAHMRVFWTVNGLFQSMGFAACVKTLAHWFPARQRGRASGWFSLSYKIGNISAWALTGWLLAYHWRWAFRVPAAMVVLVGLYILFRLEEAPGDRSAAGVAQLGASRLTERVPVADVVRWALATPSLWVMSLSCFSVALATYGFLGWLPHYLTEAGSTALAANMKAVLFPLGGCAGALAVGWVSDRLLHGRRPPVIAVALVLGGLLTAGIPLAPPQATALRMACIVLAGALVMGGHAHVVTSAAMDVATLRTAGTASGVIDAIGYLGAAATGMGTGWLVDRCGWPSAFHLWAGGSIAGGFIIATLWRRPAAGEDGS